MNVCMHCGLFAAVFFCAIFELRVAVGAAVEADPLSRSFDLRKIDIDQFSLLLAADHKGAAQDLMNSLKLITQA